MDLPHQLGEIEARLAAAGTLSNDQLRAELLQVVAMLRMFVENVIKRQDEMTQVVTALNWRVLELERASKAPK
jgi:hypothetical protein